MNKQKTNMLRYIMGGIFVFVMLIIIMNIISFVHNFKSQNIEFSIDFNNNSGLVCKTNQGIIYSDSDGVKKLENDKYLKGINSQCRLFENDSVVYAYEIKTGNIFSLDSNNNFDMKYQIDKGFDDLYLCENILFALKYFADESRIEFEVYNFLNGTEKNINSYDCKNYVSDNDNKFKLKLYDLGEIFLILDDTNTTHFFELYDTMKNKPIYAQSYNSFFIYKYSENEIISTNIPFTKSEDMCKFNLSNESIRFDSVIQKNKYNYYSRLFICRDDTIDVIGYYANSFKKNYFSDRQGDFKHNSISVYNISDFSLEHAILSKERIIAYDENYYYTYVNCNIKKYSFNDNNVISKKHLSNIDNDDEIYSFQHCDNYLFIFDNSNGKILDIITLS